VNVEDDVDETPVAWTAVTEDTPVYSSDGSHIGVTDEVLGAEDIFHGVVVTSGPMGTDIMVPAESVASITNKRIVVSPTADELRALPPYRPEESFKLGIVGLFRKHLGWVEGKDEPG
jgi:hypothetical protein